MRAFISVELPEDIKEILFNIQKELSKDCVKAKWVAKKNLHLTLKFFPEISEKKLEKIKEVLSGIKFEPFEVVLEGIGFFPSKSYIRVLWVGLQNPEKLINLQGDIELKLNKIYPKDERFSVHLTLGRIKFIKDREKFLELVKSIKVPQHKFKIDKLTLMKSTLTKDGPKYSVIEKY